MSSRPSQPRWWITLVLMLMVADFAAPPNWSVCVVQLAILPIAWRLLHRRFIANLTTGQCVAVVLPPLLSALMSWADVTWTQLVGGDSPSVRNVEPHSIGLTATWTSARLWTLAGLVSAGSFHGYLQTRLRKRLDKQRTLQQRVRQRSNQIRRVNLALRDEIARRQATQHRLDQSETTFQSLIDRMQLQVARKNVEGVITYANDKFCAEVGLPPSQVVGSTDAELYEPSLAAKYRADDLNVIMTGRAVDKIEDHPSRDGRPGYVQTFKAPEYDQHGKCIGIQVIFWDITERHRQAIALRDSEARKRALFEAAGDGVLLIDARGRIVEANTSAKNLLQSGGGRLIGLPLEDLVTPDPAAGPADQGLSGDQTLAAFHWPGDASWSSLPLTQRHQLPLRRADGSSFESEVSIHAIPTGDQENRAVIIRDITLQRDAFEAMRDAKAAAEQANLTKTQFMAGISHELRTPLGGIRGLTDLLAGLTLSAAARRYVNLIAQSTELLSDVIEDILDFAAIEAGRVAIDPVPIDLHDVVGDAFACLAVRVSDKPVRLALSVHPKTPRYVIADAKRVRQIIVNLAGNAIKFTPSGEVSVRLESVDAPEPGNARHGEFLISVRDTGIGIEPENQQRIFDAFEQGDRGTSKKFGGTGLGLAIARGLAERMGGGITVASEMGVGSTFHCRLNLVLDVNKLNRIGRQVNSSKSAAASFPTATPAAVVSVDSQTIHEGIAETLAADGWRTLTPDALAQRVDSAASSQPLHWILTDKTADSAWRGRARKSHDRVLWLIHAGDPSPRRAKREDTIIFEPLHPDELHRWLRREPVLPTRAPAHRRPTRVAHLGQTDVGSGDAEVGQALLPSRSDSPKILVVDDSATNRLVIHDQLVASGYQVITASGGQEAIDRVATTPLDCVLMDLQMPDMDGTEATIKIIEHAAREQRTPPPIIALTAHVTDEHRQQCRRSGMQGYVTKPINLPTLLAEIERLALHSAKPIAAPATIDSPPPPNEPDSPPEPMPAISANESIAASPAEETWRERLSKHCGGDPTTTASVAEAFLLEVPELMQQLKMAARRGDARQLKAAAHTLKSCLRYVAPPVDVQAAARLEKYADEPQWVEALRSHQTVAPPVTVAGETASAAGNGTAESASELMRQVQTIAQHWLDEIEVRAT